MSDIHDNNSWTTVLPGHWGYGYRYGSPSWSDYRKAFATRTPPSPKNFQAYINCTGPQHWQVYVHGEHKATAEDWEEAKALAALLVGTKEME